MPGYKKLYLIKYGALIRTRAFDAVEILLKAQSQQREYAQKDHAFLRLLPLCDKAKTYPKRPED